MIQSRKNLIEDAFYKARGSSTKVILIQQKDNLENQAKDEKTSNQIEQKNVLKINTEGKITNEDETKRIEKINNLDTNSIDQKAKKFAEFFNGEIVNLE